MGLSKFWKAAGDTPPADWAEQILRELDEAVIERERANARERAARKTANALETALTAARTEETLRIAIELFRRNPLDGRLLYKRLAQSEFDYGVTDYVEIDQPVEPLVELAEAPWLHRLAEVVTRKAYAFPRAILELVAFHPTLVRERADVAMLTQAIYNSLSDEVPDDLTDEERELADQFRAKK